MNTLKSTDEILDRLKDWKRAGSTRDTCRYTEPGKDAPLHFLDCPGFFSISFFDPKGSAVISSSPNNEIALVEILLNGSILSGPCIWVRPGHEDLIGDVRWQQALRLHQIEIY